MANHQLDRTDLGDTRAQIRLARRLAPAHAWGSATAAADRPDLQSDGRVDRARDIYPRARGQSLGMEGFIAFSMASVHIHSS